MKGGRKSIRQGEPRTAFGQPKKAEKTPPRRYKNSMKGAVEGRNPAVEENSENQGKNPEACGPQKKLELLKYRERKLDVCRNRNWEGEPKTPNQK